MKFAPSCAFSAVVACLLAESHGAFGSSLRSTANKEERKLNGHEHSYHQDPYHHDPYYQDPYYQDPYHNYPYPAYPEPVPTERPTPRPTPNPTNRPTPHPTPVPTGRPSPQPTPNPTPMPTPVPTPRPTPFATRPPVPHPTPRPSELPTRRPTDHPSAHPTRAPSPSPSDSPTPEPSSQPTESNEPSENPTSSEEPSENPTISEEPSENPTLSAEPSEQPSEYPEFRTIEEIICSRDEFSTFCRHIQIVGLNVVLNSGAAVSRFDSSAINNLINCLSDPAACRRLSARDGTTYNGSRMLQNTAKEQFFTVFAPTNTAYEEINEDVRKVFESVSGAPRKALLKNLAEFHIVNNKIIPFNGLKCSQRRNVKMRNGQFSQTACILNGRRKAQVGIANRRVMYDCFFVPNTKCKANYPEIEKIPNRDIIASNGIIHAVDDLLLPRQFAPTTQVTKAPTTKVTEAPSTDCEGVNGSF
mmetsp:Transcript_15847/g.36523  ORF Transcript_15847/g.36523 Transcript_15847/m.36523 type:complete len:472 (+) Transcript_15847:76-1491(+)|eukprot:CAMPEP_0172394654 /NCGR_PEP_ID=MMETSP1061-20121228/15859_1 /TAXON_ID=37318 /ORGANISM="Pseudo-nitzschia pungens, Strain cf. pungens" /LENGTH=471 /DNA_ID=CAMNT_0013126063 /DNA_START=64 /DNA_END=1479 /DNA_ORIENTATION=-